MARTIQTSSLKVRSLLKGPSLLVVSRVMALALSLLSAPLLARGLSVDERGIFATLASLLFILPTLLGFGLPIAVRRAAAQEKHAEALSATRTWILLLMPVFCCAGMVLWHFLERGNPDVPTGLLVAVFASSSLLIGQACDVAVLSVSHRFIPASLAGIAQQLCFTASVVIGFLAGRLDLAWTVSAFAISVLLSAIFSMTASGVFVPSFSQSALKRYMADGLKFTLSDIVEAANYRLDQIICLPLIGATQTSFYAIASTITALPIGVGQAIAANSFRRVARAAERGDRAEGATAFRHSFWYGVLLLLCLAPTLPIMIPFVFGAAYSDAVLPALIGLIGSVAVVNGVVSYSTLVAAGRARATVAAQSAGLITGIGLLCAIGPDTGAVGASISSSTGYVVAAFILAFSAKFDVADLLPARRN